MCLVLSLRESKMPNINPLSANGGNKCSGSLLKKYTTFVYSELKYINLVTAAQF